MAAVVKRTAKYSGLTLASALISGKIIGPLINQLQKNKIEENITNESIIRRFEQSLIEGETRFQEELTGVTEMIKNYYNIESLADRIRTCLQEEKRELWNDMKVLVFARIMSKTYLNYITLILSKAQMVLVAKYLSKNSFSKDDLIFEKCRTFFDEIKNFYSVLVAEICPIMIEVCKNILEFINLDFKIEDIDTIKTIFMQIKRRADASFSLSAIISCYYNSLLSASEPGLEIRLYCQSHNFQQLLDYMICDGLDEIALKGFEFIQDSDKKKIMLTWIMFSSAIFNSDQKSIDDILMKKWNDKNFIFSHLAVLFCEDI